MSRHFLVPTLLSALIVFPLDAADSPPSGDRVGTPETLAAGITESIATIMERDRTSPSNKGRRMEEADEHGHRRPFKPAIDPKAPAVSQWPPADPAQLGAKAVEAHTTIGTSFRATSTTTGESPYVPPDSMGDVGPTQLLVHVNGRVKLFDKSGVVGALNANDTAFWAAVNGGFDPTDPEVRYDRLSGRWFVMAVNLAASNNRVMIAVSSGATLTSAASFTFYQFTISSGGGGVDTANFCDYPSLGVDANALYIGCNMFDGVSGAFSRTSGFVVRKSSVLSGGPIVVTAFPGIGTAASGLWSPRGVDNDDPAATQGFFIGVDIVSFSRLQLRRVSTPGATPTISANLALNVPTTALPIGQPASGGSAIDTSDDRLMMAEIHKNKITGAVTLRTAHNIEVDATCTALAGGGGGRNGSRWYEIGSLGGTPALVQSGTLCSGAASPPGYFFPSAVTTGQGHMVLSSSVASSSTFAGIAVSGRLRTDAAGSTQAPVVAQNGLAAYTVFAGGQNRWGDYSFVGVDPLDDQTVWTFQEYADSPANNWAIRAIQLKAPPPAAPASAAPSSVCVGVASTSVTITGTSTAGSEFFDPGPDTGGPGYANHLAVAVSGGASVTAPTFVDPTHVTLTLNTVGASPGAATVTVTNPDGQAAAAPGILTLAAAPPPVDDGVRVDRVGGSARVSWNLAFGAAGSDLVRGSLGQLPVGPGGGDETCLGDGIGATFVLDGTNPALGAGFWYLIRGENHCGKGSYGTQGVNGAPGAARSTTTCS